MIGVETLSGDAQAVIYLIAFVAFVIAGIVAWLIQPRAVWATLVAGGLALITLVPFWNSLAAT